MSKSELAKLSKGINTLKRMTTSLLSTRKKRRPSKKTKSGKRTKSKSGKKTKGKKKYERATVFPIKGTFVF